MSEVFPTEDGGLERGERRKRMKRFGCMVVIGTAALLVLGMSLVQAEETKSYALGAKLLFREYNVPVAIAPLGSQERGLPSSFDWGPKAENPLGRDICGPARNQGNCGSCWAFASVACLEAWVRGTRGLSSVDLSEEVLVSNCCSAGDCNGGYLDEAADWMVAHGTTSEACWPYTASNGPCSGYCADPTLGKTENWQYACGNWWTIDINLIKQALVDHGPLATGMDVYSDFQNYNGGVYRHETGIIPLGGHAVLITGYVDKPGVPGGGYFIAKNSWGTGWGPYDGYFAIAYDSNCYFGIESTYYNGLIVYHRE